MLSSGKEHQEGEKTHCECQLARTQERSNHDEKERKGLALNIFLCYFLFFHIKEKAHRHSRATKQGLHFFRDKALRCVCLYFVF